MNDQNINKIILITQRLEENPLYKPAEEIFLHSVLEKFGLTYERIENYSSEVCNFYGKLPVIYYNGKVIMNNHFVSFVKYLVFGDNLDADFEKYIEYIIFTMKESLSNANEFYIYLKSKEKIEKSTKNKKLFSSIKSYFYRKNNYELLNNNLIHSYYQISNLKNIYSNLDT